MGEKASTPLRNSVARNSTPIRFPDAFLSSVAGAPSPSVFWLTTVRDSAIPRQKTHNIAFEPRLLCYLWHPWYGRDILTRAATGVHAEISYLCKLPEAPIDAMLVEIPRWMFDAGQCVSMRCADLAYVDCIALQALKGMLAASRTGGQER